MGLLAWGPHTRAKMTTGYRRAGDHLAELLGEQDLAALLGRLAPRLEALPPPLVWDPRATPEGIGRRWERLGVSAEAREALADPVTLATCARYARSIESMIGTVKVPVGVAGPLRINGLFARADYLVPLATTEATLVASFGRGAQLITASGGCSAAVLNEGLTRSPCFAFASLRDAGAFMAWALGDLDALRREADATTRHGRLSDVRFTVEGNQVHLHLELQTGDAAGQNMATLAADAVCRYIAAHCPVIPTCVLHEGNTSGEKRQSQMAFQSVRGRKVIAEVVVPAALVEQVLHTTPRAIERSYRIATTGSILSGAVGVHAQYANGLAALFLACGQDVACVAEAAMGVTRFEVTPEGDLYASVTLPNLVVGTVGGATGLPSQAACLELLGLAGSGHARAFAEVCAAVCLAGELSVTGALSAGEFARAHHTLARVRAAR